MDLVLASLSQLNLVITEYLVSISILKRCLWNTTWNLKYHFFVQLIPLWCIKLQTDKRMPSATTSFISPVITRYMFRPYWPSSGIKYVIFKTQNKMYIYRMFNVGYTLLFSIYFMHIYLFSVFMHFTLNFK